MHVRSDRRVNKKLASVLLAKNRKKICQCGQKWVDVGKNESMWTKKGGLSGPKKGVRVDQKKRQSWKKGSLGMKTGPCGQQWGPRVEEWDYVRRRVTGPCHILIHIFNYLYEHYSTTSNDVRNARRKIVEENERGAGHDFDIIHSGERQCSTTWHGDQRMRPYAMRKGWAVEQLHPNASRRTKYSLLEILINWMLIIRSIKLHELRHLKT